MFQKLFEFEYERNFKEAVGFYIVYFLLVILLAGLIGGLVGLIISNGRILSMGMRIGNLVAVVISLILSFLILKNKSLLNNFKYIIVSLFSGVLALFGGALLGLLPVAFLTTRKKLDKKA